MKCPNCGFESSPEMRFCGMCGVRLTRTCPECGFINPLTYSFCGMCGTPLVEGKEAGLPATILPKEVFPSSMVKPARRSASQMAREPLAGERRIATILVVDVWHSTDLLERVGTEDWVEIMNQLLQLLESKVHHFGGEVDQFRGDGLIAFFGATSAHEDDPERAILAALWMQKAVKTYAAELEERYDVDLRIRVGINTGEVIVTSVGNQEYREDTAMGEAITIAARMESAAEAGTVLVSENTYRLARSQFEWESLGEIRVKGVSEPLHVYRPVAPHADAMWSQGMYSYGFAIPLIGRQHEFRILKTCIEDLYDGRGGIAMVTGDKGSGKSFLVAHVRQYFERQGMLFAEAQSRDVNPSPADAANAAPSCPPRVTWLRGRCRSYDQSWPYTVWVDLLQDWLGMRYTEPMQVGRSPDLHKEEIAARLRQRSEALWGAQFTEYYPSLATFLSLPLEEEFQERVRHLSAEGVQRQFFLAARSWVEALGKRGPLVLTFADMHWADTSSLELLTHCLPLCDTEPLLWLLVFRPDRASPVWSFHHYLETEYPHRLSALSIPPLTEEQSVEFISRLIGAGTLPQETLQLVVRKAEGNPYYIKELVNALVAQGVLIHDPETGQWQSTRPVTTLDLPDSLQNLLLARIDRLAAEERQVLQVASVVGTVFWWNVLHSMVNGITDGPAKLKDYLTVLQRRQLIHERRRVPELGREYAFNSSLIRDVAYDSLLRSQREAYHRQAADYLEGLLASVEGLTSSTAPQRYGMVAYHYEQAGALDKALVYTLKAAKQAETFYANTEALGHYHHALELLDELAARIPAAPAGDESAEEARRELLRQRFEVLNHRRAVYYLLGELESGRADARAMLDLARQLEDHPELLVDALLEQPGVGNVQGREELEAGIEMARQALEIARSLGDRHREMRCLMALGGLYNLSKDPAWQDVGHQALELARELGDQRAEVKLLLGLGRAYGTDNFERSMEYFEAALPIVHELDDKSAEISLLSAMRMPLERSGDYYRMLVEYERKRLRISREIGDHYAEAHALMLCGQIEGLWLGDYEAGLELEYESLEFYSGITSSVYPLLRIAQMEVDLGRTEAALAALARAYPIGEQAVRDIGRAGLGLVRAIVYNACGDEAHLQMALEAAEGVRWMVDEQLVSEQYRIAALCEASAAHLGLAAVLVDAGACQHHREAALTLSRAAVDIYENFGFMQIVECSSEEALFRHSMALSINGQIEAAHDFLKRAYDEMMRKHAMIPPDSHYRQTFLNNIPIHRNIRIAYATSSMQLTWDGSKIQLRFDER